MSTFPERLKEARINKGFTCRALSERIESAESTVSQIERGSIENPGAKTVAALAAALDVSIDWLLTGEGRGPSAVGPNEAA